MTDSGMQAKIPLCVDLDGTLLKTDTFWESVMLLIKHHPLQACVAPFWLLQGKAYLKEKVAENVILDVAELPYYQPLLDFLGDAEKKGRPLVLVTGAHSRIARAVQGHLGIFGEVLGSEAGVNLTGKNKARVLVQKYGEKGFDYIGNSRVDLDVWSHARNAILVNVPRGVLRQAGSTVEIEHVFDDRPPLWRAFLKAVRPHQWLKNILIFVPVITSHGLGDTFIVQQALLAFVGFSLVTSSVYLLNDLLDLPADRRHPRKRFRSLASGDLPIPIAVFATPVLIAAGIVVSFLLPPMFHFILLLYFLTTFAYSFYLKQIVIVDVLVLAGLYTVRILAGHAATGIPHSLWLLLFSMFFFFSLALIKRYSELESFKREQRTEVLGRGYVIGDREQIGILGSASGYIAALILALYITSDSVIPLYGRPYMLWLLIPLMIYWISRIWLLAHRGKVHDDPVIFALKDPVSYGVGVCMAVVLLLAT